MDLSSSSDECQNVPSDSSDDDDQPVDVMARIRAASKDLEETNVKSPNIVHMPGEAMSNTSSFYDSGFGSSVDPPSFHTALPDLETPKSKPSVFQEEDSIARCRSNSSVNSAFSKSQSSSMLSSADTASSTNPPDSAICLSPSDNTEPINVQSSALCLPSQAATNLHTIGGTVVSKSREITGRSSNDALPVVLENLLRQADQHSCSTRVESNDRQLNIFLEQNHVQDAKFVNVGPMIVNPEEPTNDPQQSEPQPTAEKKFRGDTARRIEKWTNGMVQTQGSKAILQKIKNGKTWIVVTGSPGEGKTTAGYLALKQLDDIDRQVYDIQTPEDYFKTKESKECILMLDDIFGALHFDLQKVSRWEDVLNDLLKMKEHTNTEETGEKSKRPKRVVLMICRSTVLNEASHHLGKYKDLMLDGENIIDFTHGMNWDLESLVSERMDIWKSHASKYNVSISDDILSEVCEMTTSHGFPHCCRLFADMRVKNHIFDMKHFFRKPLEFLNQTMESLVANASTGKLLREMIRNNGCLDLDSIEDDEIRFQYGTILESLSGSYLTEDEGIVMFHHPSIYDSAAFVMCEKDPLYVIKYCTLSFLNDRIRFEGLQACFQHETHKRKTIGKRYAKSFIQRLKAEIIKGDNLGLALSHLSLNDAGFASGLMESICESKTERESVTCLQQIIRKKDRETGESFLFLMTKSKSDKILQYVCEKLDLSQEDLADILFGACEHVSVPSIQYFIEKNTAFDFNVKNKGNETPLIVSAKKHSSRMLELLLSTNIDVTNTDKYDITALHNICRFGVDDEGVINTIIEKGMGTNQPSQNYPSLPLCIASYEGHKNVVAALLDCGSEIDLFQAQGRTPLHFACMWNHLEVVRLLFDRGADMKKAYCSLGSLITIVTKAGHARIVEELIKRGANPHYDSCSREYPLYWACHNFSFDVIQVLLEAGADMNVLNEADTSPFFDACSWGREDLVRFLLERGADVNKTDNFFKLSALHRVAAEGHAHLVKLLLSNGADVNKLDKSGATALFRASNKATVHELLRRGANVNVVDNRGNTALYLACFTRLEEVVMTLLHEGADINVKNKRGNTVFDRATSWGNKTVIDAILKRRDTTGNDSDSDSDSDSD